MTGQLPDEEWRSARLARDRGDASHEVGSRWIEEVGGERARSGCVERLDREAQKARPDLCRDGVERTEEGAALAMLVPVRDQEEKRRRSLQGRDLTQQTGAVCIGPLGIVDPEDEPAVSRDVREDLPERPEPEPAYLLRVDFLGGRERCSEGRHLLQRGEEV
ncbi:MAG: hypothetical protein ABI134_06075, partial [Byssovorax sp.]